MPFESAATHVSSILLLIWFMFFQGLVLWACGRFLFDFLFERNSGMEAIIHALYNGENDEITLCLLSVQLRREAYGVLVRRVSMGCYLPLIDVIKNYLMFKKSFIILPNKMFSSRKNCQLSSCDEQFQYSVSSSLILPLVPLSIQEKLRYKFILDSPIVLLCSAW